MTESAAASKANPVTWTGESSAAPVTAEFRPRYLLAMVAGVALVVVSFVSMLVVLQKLSRLPPPAFSNSLCEDEKLLDLRDRHRSDTPNVLAVGSSVAWRHFDGTAVVKGSPGALPLNAAFCGLRISQTEYVLPWLLRQYPSTREVVALVVPQDFQSCSKPEVPVFDLVTAQDFFDRRSWFWSYYMRHFSFSFFWNAAIIKEAREGRPGYTLFQDKFGSSPIDPFAPGSFRELWYGALTDLDPECFAALRRIALHLAEGRQRLVVATTPLHPEWVERYGDRGALIDEFNRRITEALAGTRAVFWDGHTAMGLAGEEFVDAIHTKWAAAQRFSTALVAATKLGSSAELVADEKSLPNPTSMSFQR
jgi:hypothetical protein